METYGYISGVALVGNSYIIIKVWRLKMKKHFKKDKSYLVFGFINYVWLLWNKHKGSGV